VLILGAIIVKMILAFSKRTLSRSKMEKITQTFVYSILKFVLNIVFVLILISVAGIPVTGFVAAISAAGLAIGLSLQNSVSNVANGMIIVSTKPFKQGDFVSINSVEGKIEAIRILSTKIVTLDNKVVIIPNSAIVDNPIINYSANMERRVDFRFSVAYQSDVLKVKKIITDVIKSNGKVIVQKNIFVTLDTLEVSNIQFFAYCWCDSEDFWDVYYYVLENVFNEFKKNKIAVPFNQMEIHLKDKAIDMPFDKSELPKRVAKKRKRKVLESDILEILKNETKKRKKNKRN
ncbi:MAG: mechanosensitive ion channel, partial [Clostridia bacterium]